MVSVLHAPVNRFSSNLLPQLMHADYEGVGLSSRDANSKKAASEATAIFQNYYPEFLVCFFRSIPCNYYLLMHILRISV